MPVNRKLILVITILVFSVLKLFAQDKHTPALYPLNYSSLYAGPFYIVNPNYAIFQSQNIRKIIYADMKTFKTFRGGGYGDHEKFAIDKNGIYFEGVLIKTDTTGFEIVGMTNSRSHIFWKTKYKVFDNQNEITGADAPTFVWAGYDAIVIFKDKNTVYYLDKKISGSDPLTVKVVNWRFFDKNYVYNKDSILAYQGKQLQSVNSMLAKTDDEVIGLLYMAPLTNIDAKTLTPLSFDYAADKYHVYYQNIPLQNANTDVRSIKVWKDFL